MEIPSSKYRDINITLVIADKTKLIFARQVFQPFDFNPDPGEGENMARPERRTPSCQLASRFFLSQQSQQQVRNPQEYKV